MSWDLDIYLSNPLELSFDIHDENDPRQRYRLIDPPLARYLLGISRKIAHIPTIENDWDWSKTWDENLLNQALPNITLLYTGRMMLTIFLLRKLNYPSAFQPAFFSLRYIRRTLPLLRMIPLPQTFRKSLMFRMQILVFMFRTPDIMEVSQLISCFSLTSGLATGSLRILK